jgi:hypothetical protein
MDIPELAHLDNSYEFLNDPCFKEESFFEYSYRVNRLLHGAWSECAARNPEFKWCYFDQYAYCVLKRKRAEQSLLMMLHFAERDGMIMSYQERDVTRGFCGWMGITVIKHVEFNAFLKGLHNGFADNYIRALFRRASLVPISRNWKKAFRGSEAFIFDARCT